MIPPGSACVSEDEFYPQLDADLQVSGLRVLRAESSSISAVGSKNHQI